MSRNHLRTGFAGEQGGRAENAQPVSSPLIDNIIDVARTKSLSTSSHSENAGIQRTSRHAHAVDDNVLPLLRYRKTSIWLAACYLPFLILPWILTCIMVLRPPSLPSYYNQKGEYGDSIYLVMLFWMGFVRVLNAIANVLVVPITSALLAHGAVVYSQRP